METPYTTNQNSKRELDAVTSILEIKKMTDHTWLVTKMGNGIWRIFEYLCYLMCILLILTAVVLPNGEISKEIYAEENIKINANLTVEEIITFFTILKIIVALCGFMMIIPAVLFRKLRKKNYLLETVYDKCNLFLRKHGM